MLNDVHLFVKLFRSSILQCIVPLRLSFDSSFTGFATAAPTKNTKHEEGPCTKCIVKALSVPQTRDDEVVDLSLPYLTIFLYLLD